VAVQEHKAASPGPSSIRVAVLTVSDTRTLDTDQGGALVEQMAREAGFQVAHRELVRDEPAAIRDQIGVWAPARPAGAPSAVLDAAVHAILITGGTGVAPRDTTVDVVAPLFERQLLGFGELFRMLSFAEIGSAAMLSRASAGIVHGVPVFVMPGSPSAVRLALGRLVLPELGHLVAELRRPAHGPGQKHGHGGGGRS
jgi:molybdenum cofactor biosynthesis protein B